MDKMFLIFNRGNGDISHLPLQATVRLVKKTYQMNITDELSQMHDGEYVHVVGFCITCSTGGITLDELKGRKIKG